MDSNTNSKLSGTTTKNAMASFFGKVKQKNQLLSERKASSIIIDGTRDQKDLEIPKVTKCVSMPLKDTTQSLKDAQYLPIITS